MDAANDVSNTAVDKASKDFSKDLLALQKTNQRLMGGMICMGLLALVTCGVSIAVAVLVQDFTDSQEGSASMAISANDVLLVQDAWADAVLSISNTYLGGGDFVAVAGAAAAELYGYGHSDVLFKPTLASVNQFRPTATGALSYFVGSSNVANGYAEDGGFAINGGKGWSAVVFENHQIEISGNVAAAMGNYYFTSADDGKVSKVEYSFGYKRSEGGKLRIFLHHSSKPYEMPISRAEVLAVQDAWANAVVNISNTYLAGGDFVAVAGTAAAELYGYGHSNVLFKPTLASVNQFRPTATGALSYFVGSSNVANGYAEDGGFAINGGKGWSAAVFENHQIEISGNVAAAMGNYYFTSADDGKVSKVEYSFGYKRSEDGKLRIFLHHSSKPYEMPISRAEVLAVQDAWANAVVNISNTYLAGGDFVAVAGAAAAELYGYGHSNVLFKPTLASVNQFRPTATGALSYFVGSSNVANGYAEDGGFAINGGKGWSAVVFENHQIEISGNVAAAMGNYYFTSADDGNVSKVEYSFNYKRTEDGKLRIFLHHSSKPYSP